MTTTSWTITLPGAAVALRFDRADPDVDAPLLHAWLHRPHVAPWWGPDRTIDETRDYLVRQRGSAHLVPWIVSAEGSGPFGYVETYRPADDPLADWFPVLPTDRGWHVLVGPPEAIGSGLPRLMGRAVLAYLLSDPVPSSDLSERPSAASASERGPSGPAPQAPRAGSTVERVICEPNELNTRMLGYCKALGYDVLAAVDLPTKRALILACSRAVFEERWPGDLAALSER